MRCRNRAARTTARRDNAKRDGDESGVDADSDSESPLEVATPLPDLFGRPR